jgi:alpha-N-arabinofuranosidase
MDKPEAYPTGFRRVGIVTKAAVLCLTAGLASAQNVSLTVNTGNVLHAIDQRIYGLTLDPVDGGLWGEVVWNRSFEQTLTEGAWKVNAGVLEAAGDSGLSRFRFGAETWRDYDLSVDVRRPSGNGVLMVTVRSFYRGILNHALSLGEPGGFEVSRTALDPGDNYPRTEQPKTSVLRTAAGQIENGRWYRVRMRTEGARLQVWLDGKALFDLTDEGGPPAGQVSLAVRGGAGSFANLSVKSTDGAPLLAGVPTAARYWHAAGTGETAPDTDLPLNGTYSLRMISRDSDSGIEQPGYAVRAGDALRGSLWLEGTGPGLVVRLVDGSKVLAEQTVGAPGAEWREFPLLLNPAAASGNATLRILARAGSLVKLDQVSLMPDSYRANGGFRTDLTQAVAALHPSVIRWPGRQFLYRWKDGIGPQAKRVSNGNLDEWDPHSFGIDEFLAFARKVGADPVIVIPVGWRRDRETFLQDAVDLVAYCNGPRDSVWGKVRAQNGHPEPYRVKYWEIADDTSGELDAFEQFILAMKKVDPAIRTIASRGIRLREEELAVIREAAHLANYVSIDQGENWRTFADRPSSAAQSWKPLEEEIARSRNTKLKLFVSEFNVLSADWSAGLYAGGILNSMERDEAVGMAAPAPCLRHVIASSRDNALINFDQRSWFPSPAYVVRKLYREHYAQDLLEVKGELAGLSATATRTSDGETIYLKLVNPGDREVVAEVTLRGDFPLLSASMQLVAPDSLDARNTLEQPTAVQVVEGKVERAGMSARLRLPRWSVAVVTLSR